MVFTLLHLDTGHLHPLSNRGDLLGFFEYDGPVLQAHPAHRGGRYTLSAPEVETEVVMVAAGRHERGCAGHQRHEFEAEHVAVEAQPRFRSPTCR